MESNIEYRGISKALPEGLSLFREEILTYTIKVDKNSEISEINRFSASISAKLVEVFNTPEGTFDDRELTGVMGVTHIDVSCTIEYVSNNDKLIIEKVKLSKKSYIVLPKDYNIKLPFDLHGYIQYLYINKFSNDSFYISIVSLISL